MPELDVITPVESAGELPVIRSIDPADLKEVLRQGLDDFWAMPTHVIFVSLIYPLVGLVLGRAALGYDFIPLLYPLAAGFALIGPFAAIGLYELSRRRESGLDTHWKHMFDVFRSPSIGAILTLGLILLVLFLVWIAVANAIFAANFPSDRPMPLAEFVQAVLYTPPGRNLIIVGNVVGFLFAVLAFTISVVSFPLLLDRHASAPVAVFTSVRAVLKNPLTMALWGLIVAAALLIGSLPLFVGLAVVMPILGHSTWHLYRRVVEPDLRPRPGYEPRPKPERYAADFPVALFPRRRRDEG